MEIIAKGAEAQIIKINEKILEKIRFKKNYRLDIIDDKIRKSRCKSEFKILNKLYQNKILVPKPYQINIDKNLEKISFTFENLGNCVLKNKFNKKYLYLAFEQIIKMHNVDVIHSDLTTLNMILKNEKIFLIDFGLSYVSKKIEDKAIDLNLFFNCIRIFHQNFYNLREELEKLYIKKATFGEKIILRLKQIDKRGRNLNKQ